MVTYLREMFRAPWRLYSRGVVVFAHMAAACPVVIFLLLAALFNPAALENGDGLAGVLPKCQWDATIGAASGMDCPTCGMTRAVSALMRFDPATAADYHRGAFVLYPLAVLYSAVVAVSLIANLSAITSRL